METRYIQPFIDATLTVFNNLFEISPVVQTPYLLLDKEEFKWDLSALIGIAGEVRGVVALSFREFFSTMITSKIMEKEVKEINEDVIDTFSEIVNIVARNAKKGLEEFRLVVSLPSIVKGHDHQIGWPGKSIPIICVPFQSAYGRFNLAVCLENINF
jgi:chemotaxis protein CheX